MESTIKELNRQPPSVPVVVLLGGSAARECITTEPAWSAQIAALGGGRVRALNFGSSSQAFKNGLTIVNALPAVPTIVLIGLNVGRYTSIPPESLPSAAPATGRGGGVYDSHRFHDGQQLSDAAKRGIVRTWLAVKYPRFKARYAGNAAVLRELIALCQEKGFYPVLVELPLNLPIVRHSWDAARDRYRRGARSAAARRRHPLRRLHRAHRPREQRLRRRRPPRRARPGQVPAPALTGRRHQAQAVRAGPVKPRAGRTTPSVLRHPGKERHTDHG